MQYNFTDILKTNRWLKKSNPEIKITLKKKKSPGTYLHRGGSSQALGHGWTGGHSAWSHSTNGSSPGKWHGDAHIGTQAQDSC